MCLCTSAGMGVSVCVCVYVLWVDYIKLLIPFLILFVNSVIQRAVPLLPVCLISLKSKRKCDVFVSNQNGQVEIQGRRGCWIPNRNENMSVLKCMKQVRPLPTSCLFHLAYPLHFVC